jgi:ribonuclease-3
MTTSNAALDALQQRLGWRFANHGLLQRALTHRSFGAEHNERLEFLGDAVLTLASSTLLVQRFANSPEGDLTRVRAHLVREENLHRLGLALGLPSVLRLSEGEMRGGGATRASIVADALEAVLGAVYLDGGHDAALAVVQGLLGADIADGAPERFTKDAKTALQEWLQGRRLPVPVYRIAAARGPAHAQTFLVECEVVALSLAEQGEGSSRRTAEQQAAQRLLDKLEAGDKPGGPLRA